jgi:hypothetical protein
MMQQQQQQPWALAFAMNTLQQWRLQPRLQQLLQQQALLQAAQRMPAVTVPCSSSWLLQGSRVLGVPSVLAR